MDAVGNSDYATSNQRHHHPQQQGRTGHQHSPHYAARPQYGGGGGMSPNPYVTQYSHQDYKTQHATTAYSPHYSSRASPRNYTDSQLGVGGRGTGGSGVGQPLQQYSSAMPTSMRSPPHSQQQQEQQQQHGAPRAPHHETALKDRGSAENSDDGYNGQVIAKGSYGSNNTNRHDRNMKSFQARGMQSSDGRHTPVRDGNIEVRSFLYV